MERVYGRRKYVGGVGKFEECKREDKKIQEGEIRGRNTKNKSEERKGDEVKSRGREIQKRRVTREIYYYELKLKVLKQ